MDQQALNLKKEDMKIFIPIVKVDEEKRLVFGRVSEEKADSSNETFDYSTSKPFYQEWTEYFQKATDGKSYGNLRAMHDAKKASGFIQNLNLDDQEKAVEVVAKVVDEDDWKKCLEGVYTGFSQGGRYVRKWFDGKTNRYTAAPNEISLVDYPALKTATFSLIKADGIVEEKSFKSIPEEKKQPEKTGEADLKKSAIENLKKWAGEEISDAISAAQCLQSIYYLYEKELGEEEADQVVALKAAIENLKNFIASEIKETGEEGVMMMMEKIEEIKKIAGELTDELIKAHSKETMTKIQSIHDHSADMGAKCNDGSKKVEEEGDLKKINDQMVKVLSDNEALKKRVEELEKLPAPPKGVKLEDPPLTKADDGKINLEKAKEIKEPIDMLKKAHSEPHIYSLEKPM